MADNSVMIFLRPFPHATVARIVLGVSGLNSKVSPFADALVLALIVVTFLFVRAELQRRKADRRLREGGSRTRAILDAAGDGFVAMSADGVVTEWNAAAVRMFGWTADESVGRRLSELIIPPKDRPAHEAGLHRFALTGEGNIVGQRTQVRALRRDGSTLQVELAVGGVFENGARNFIAFIQDVTDRSRHESELAKAHHEALEGSRLKSDFLTNMSHEIRTPLNGVIGMTSLLLETDLDDAQRRGAQTVLGSGQALLEVIDAVLDFSNIEAGRIDLDKVEFDVRQLIGDVTAALAGRANDKGVVLGAHVHRDVPARVYGDARRVRQVLSNLLNNALKFTAQGEVNVEVSVEPGGPGATTPDDLALRVEVMDTGIGVAREHQHRIFSSFTQVDSSTTRRYGGSGLGLAISQKLVELMGGRIGVRSSIGRGSTFWFTIAVEPACALAEEHCDTTNIEHADQPTVAEVTVPAGAGHRIGGRLARPAQLLVAEDNPINQRVVVGMLESFGCEVHVAGNGHEAVTAATSIEFDLIFMDCQMPVMDGYAATASLRAAGLPGRRTPIVALTASAMQQDRQRCLDAGMDGHLAKPVSKNDLAAVLERFVGDRPGTVVRTRDDVGQRAGTRSAIAARLDEVYEGFDEDTEADRAELLESFRGRAAAEMDEIAAAVDDLDLAKLCSRAHSVKGMAANIGADTVADAASAIEDAARDGRPAAIPASVATLRQAIVDVDEVICIMLRESLARR